MDVTRLSANMYRIMGMLCLDDDVVLLDKTHSLFERGITYEVDHVCVALVTYGSADFQIDSVTYHVQANDMLVIIQQQRVKRLGLSRDFEARVLLMSRAYIEYLNMADAKAMLQSITRNFGLIMGREKGVRVNTVSQSPTMTTAGQGISCMDRMIDYVDKVSPIGNATADDCADYILMLFSDLTRKVTMQNLYHDGGYSNILPCPME